LGARSAGKALSPPEDSWPSAPRVMLDRPSKAAIGISTHASCSPSALVQHRLRLPRLNRSALRPPPAAHMKRPRPRTWPNVDRADATPPETPDGAAR
jgi:hypothetical protein